MATWGVALSPGVSALMEFEEKREKTRERDGTKVVRATAADGFLAAAVCEAWHFDACEPRR